MAEGAQSTNSNGTAARWFIGARWALVGLGLVALAVVTALVLGLAAIVWVPFVLLVGCAMLTVWAARRRRQLLEGRNPLEVKDAPQVAPRWPSEGVIDDRLPEP